MYLDTISTNCSIFSRGILGIIDSGNIDDISNNYCKDSSRENISLTTSLEDYNLSVRIVE